jgi:hypothetical protein
MSLPDHNAPGMPNNIVIQSWRGPGSLAAAAKQGYRGLLSNGYYIDLMWSAARHYAVDEVVIAPIGYCEVHPQATVDGSQRYRSGDADDRHVLAVGAADTVDRAQGADAICHQQRAQAVQPRIAVRRIGRVQLTACADPFQGASVLVCRSPFAAATRQRTKNSCHLRRLG